MKMLLFDTICNSVRSRLQTGSLRAPLFLLTSLIALTMAGQKQPESANSAVKTVSTEADIPFDGTVVDHKEKTILQLKEQLKQCKTGRDSIPVLYNLFDLTLGKIQTDYGFMLFRTASQAGREDVAFDALRNLANYNMKNDSILEITENLVNEFPPSDDQKHTLTFIRIMRNTRSGYFNTPDIKSQQLQELLREITVNPPKDLYDRIVLLHSLCVNLADVTEGELLSKYLTHLGKLIQETPTSDRALQNAYYVWASIIYTKTHHHDRAIDACEKLLDVINSLDDRNKRIGRTHRNYAANRYIIYTRLLENYEGLSPEEIEKYYKLAKEQVAIDEKAAGTYRKAPLPDIFYAYANKDYQKVFDLIASCKNEPYLTPRRLQLTGMYIEAAKKINNRDALLEAYPEYVKLLEEEMTSKQAERSRELQVIYEINEIKNENTLLQQAQQDTRNRMLSTYIYVSAAVFILLIIFLILLWRINSRSRHLAAQLKEANDSLSKESQSLRKARTELEQARDKARNSEALKTDFITNMSHEVTVPLQNIQEYAEMIVENTDDDKKKYMSTFAQRLSFNCELVNTIINDVLRLSEISNSTLKIKKKPSDIKPICETAMDAIRSRVAPGVKFILKAEDAGTDAEAADDFAVNTDRHRLIQILANLLSNAAKFTSEGDIVLTYGRSADRSQAVFTVTDTGRGIDPRYHTLIFERFAKLDNSIPGAGLGLTIARMLAELLGGSLIIDPAYTMGARFILTLPLS